MALHGAPHRYNTRMACLVSPVVGLISSVVYFVIMLYDLWSSPNQDTIGKQKTKKRMIHLNRMGLPNLHELVNRWELLVNADGNPVFSDPEALRIKEGIDQSENSYWCVPWGSMGSVLRILKETLSQPISSRINDNEDLDFFHRQWVSEFETLPSWMFIEPNTEMFTEFFEWIPESIRISTTCTKSLNIENYEVQLLLSIIQRVTGFPNADVMGGVWALYVRPLVDGLVDKDLSRRDSN